MLYRVTAVKTLLQHDFIRFCIVGASGFVINAALLTLLDKNLGSPFVAQLIEGEIALFSNFMFHNKWTYKKDVLVEKPFLRLVVQFHLTSWAAIIGSALLVGIGVKYVHLAPIVALAISSALALSWNFGWARYIIWRKQGAQAP